MTGKAILLVVMASFIIFARFGIQNASVTNKAFDNMASYTYQNAAYNAAVAGANIAFARLNELTVNPPYQDTIVMNNIKFNGSTFSVSCAPITGTANFRLTSIGTCNGKTATVEVAYQPGNWGNYAYYSNSEGGTIWWTRSDSVFGPFHTQDNTIHVRERPYFGGDFSMKGEGDDALDYNSNKETDYPNFQKSFTPGLSITMDTHSMDSTLYGANHGGKIFVGADATGHYVYSGRRRTYVEDTPATRDLTLVFNGSNVTYTFGSTTQTVPISTLTSNGVIYMNGGNIHTKGVIDGQVTLLATETTSSTHGAIYLDDDITLSGDPRTNPGCNDFLGLVATNNILITNNSNNDNDIKIDAAIFSLKGGFGAENHDTRGKDGVIKLFGGIVQNTRQAVGTVGSDGNINSGFSKSYHYDGRFQNRWPPFYPCGPSFRVISWYDGVGSSANRN